jgi:hypothetical protein
MKLKRYTLILLVLFLAACKKERQPSPDPSAVSINGESYPTVVIGKQEWTTINYNGAGGKEGNFRVVNSNYKNITPLPI